MGSKKTKSGKHTSHGAKGNTGTDVKNLPRDLCKSMILTLGIEATLIGIGSLMLSFTADPLAWATLLGVVLSAVTAFLGGVITIRIHKQNALMCGLCIGSLCLAALFLISLGFRSASSRYSPTLSLLMHLGVPLLSVAGAYLGRPSLKRKKHKRKLS
jgi:putative membrane protein (TIGR04086 family)